MTIDFNKLLTALYVFLFSITPFLMFHKTSELFEFNKMLFIYTIALIVAVVWISRSIAVRTIIIKKTPFDVPILLFLGSQILSTIFSIDQHTSIFGFYGRFNGGLLSIIAYIVLYYGFVSNFSAKQARKLVKQILKLSIAISALVMLWGLPGIFGHDLTCLIFTGEFNNSCWTSQFRPAHRMFSTLGQPNWLGAYLVANFFIGLYFFVNTAKKYAALGRTIMFSSRYGTYLVFSTLGIALTRSRSAALALVIGSGVFVVLHFYKTHKQQVLGISRSFAAGFIILGILVTSVYLVSTSLFGGPAKDFIQALTQKTAGSVKTKELTESTDSFEIRRIVWRGAYELGLSYPLFGTGVETFGYSYYFKRPQDHNLTSEWDFLYNKAHNEFLQYFATTGFLGLGAYLLLVGSVSARGFTYFWHRKKGILALAFSTSYFSILITNFFGFSTTMTNIYFYLIPAFLVVIYAPEPLQSLPARVHLTHRTRQVLLYILPFVVLVYGLYYVANYLAADIFYARAEAFKRTQDFDSAFQNALIARTLRSEHVYEDLLSSILANSVLINSYALSETKELEELIKLSDNYSAQAVRRSPQNVAYWKTKARNNFLFYQAARDKAYYSKSLKALRIAQKLAPTDPKLYYTHALFAYSLYQDSPGEVDLKIQALKKLDKSIELKKDYRDAYFLKAQILIVLGDKNQAKKQLEYILDNIDPSDIQAQEELRTL